MCPRWVEIEYRRFLCQKEKDGHKGMCSHFDRAKGVLIQWRGNQAYRTAI